MHAIVVEPGSEARLRWQEVPDPALRHGEVLIRIAATAVNRADLLQRRGKYPPPSGAPEWMGLEASGVVETLASGVEGLQPGDHVCCLLAGGGYAERVVCDARLVLPVPEGLSLEEAASLPEVFATAYLNLFLEANLSAGETVLVHAGASGVGIAAIQLCHALGTRVLTTVGSEAKATFTRDLGADEVIRHDTEDVTQRLESLTREHGLDVVLDCLGGEDLGRHFSMLAKGGRWVVIGLLQGRTTELDLRALLSGRLRLMGSTLRTRPVEEKGELLAELKRRVWPLFAEGGIRPVVHAALPIQEAEAAHAILERRENIGKVVLTV